MAVSTRPSHSGVAADALVMDVSGASGVGQVYAVKMEKIAQTATKAEGEAAVQLIETAAQAAPPPVGPNGEGSRINTYA